MANPTDISGGGAFRFPANMEATTAQQDLTLDPRRTYTLVHIGKDVNLAALSANIVFSFSEDGTAATVTATGAASDNKLVLTNGMSVEIGPGIKTLSFKTPSGSPLFGVLPGVFETYSSFG